MIDTLVIVVYDRLDNLKHWFYILNQCNKPKNVVVIHNYDSPQEEYKTLCDDNGAQYLHRNNIGFDIGAFQDVCSKRLTGFPEWNQLLWVTDDTFPMQSDFLNSFSLHPGEGVRCMEISPYVREHIRTTGFSIGKQTASRLIFPADPVVTKQHCYLFEHRDRHNTFLAQIRKMRLSVKMVAPRERSPLFDTGYHRRLKREDELLNKWTIKIPDPAPVITNKVTVICPVYNSFPAVISSLIMQTYKHWQLILIHDGPSDGSSKAFIDSINDDRIEYVETEKRVNNWGHQLRADYLQKVNTEYVLITNPDNYYTPNFLQKAIAAMKTNAVATYSQQIVHSYTDWKVMNCRLARGFIDCGQVLMKAKEVKEVGWNDTTNHSADWFFFKDVADRYGADKFIPFPGCHFIHN